MYDVKNGELELGRAHPSECVCNPDASSDAGEAAVDKLWYAELYVRTGDCRRDVEQHTRMLLHVEHSLRCRSRQEDPGHDRGDRETY